jgi:hypothetical protein
VAVLVKIDAIDIAQQVDQAHALSISLGLAIFSPRRLTPGLPHPKTAKKLNALNKRADGLIKALKTLHDEVADLHPGTDPFAR